MSLSTVSDGVASVRDAIADCAPTIQAGLVTRRHALDGVNPSGQDTLAADVYADEVLASRLTSLDAVGAYASEERADVVADDGPLSCCVDPLDGSSNVKSANPTGIIFTVYDADLPAAGTDLVAAGYVLFGSTTTMIVASDGTVTRSVVADDGSLRTVDDDVSIPDEPTVCAIGGRRTQWSDGFRAWADEFHGALKTRYSGALVADVTQVLTYGGLFAYPALQDRPEGKLRQQFEANPMAYVLEAAGGRSSDGSQSLLETPAEDIHGRVPVYLGNDGLIERLERDL